VNALSSCQQRVNSFDNRGGGGKEKGNSSSLRGGGDGGRRGEGQRGLGKMSQNRRTLWEEKESHKKKHQERGEVVDRKKRDELQRAKCKKGRKIASASKGGRDQQKTGSSEKRNTYYLPG